MAHAPSALVLTAPGLLVVRASGRWAVTPNGFDQPVAISGDALLALTATSGGAPLHLPADEHDALLAAGALVPATDTPPPRHTDQDGAEPVTDPAEVPTGAWTAPAAAFLGRIDAGSLLVESPDGVASPLDSVDLVLVDAVDEVTTAGEVLGRCARRPVAGSVPPDQLAGRLRRLAALGLIRLAADPAPVPAPPVTERAAEQPARPPGWAARLRRTRVPGRRHLVALARRLRLLPSPPAAALPATAPDVEVAPHPPPAVEPVAGIAPPAGDPCVDGRLPDRVPVYAVFQPEIGPLLALGMLTASARHHADGALNEHFEIRRPEGPESFLADLATRDGPAVLLCSNYVWSLEHNLALATRAKALNPALFVVHGGPSTPKYEGDCHAFFADHGAIADVTVRNEGEVTISHVLAALGGGAHGLDAGRLADVEGISYKDPSTGEVVSTPDRDRVKDLDALPSPYVSGEFDHLPREAWPSEVTFETNRGCPYGCTFCDWGSSTLSRLRMFPLDRVREEMEWAARHGLRAWVLADANTGIMSRDVEVVDMMVEVKQRFGVPHNLGFNVAKNTTKHLTAIVDRLVGAGIVPHLSLALQSTDEATLDAVRRTNINTDHYVALASSFRRRGLPLQADLMLGLPGQTLDSFTGDLQFLTEHEIPARIWITQLLPNSPMNHPDYRAEFAVEADEHRVVRSTSSFTPEDRRQMMRLRHAYTVFERFGLLRHVRRFVQWDHGVLLTDLLQRATDVSERDARRYPLLDWVLRYFDYYQAPPFGWRSFYAEVRRFLVDELGVPLTAALDDVLELQAFLMPAPGRRFPATIGLRHDYASYVADNTASLWTSGHFEPTKQPLADYPSATLTVTADPLDQCNRVTDAASDPRNESMTDEFWMVGHWELDSALVTPFASVTRGNGFTGQLGQMPPGVADVSEELDRGATSAVRVRLGRDRTGVG